MSGRRAAASRLSARPMLTPTRAAVTTHPKTTPSRTTPARASSRAFGVVDEDGAPAPEQPAIAALLQYKNEGVSPCTWAQTRVLAAIECVRRFSQLGSLLISFTLPPPANLSSHFIVPSDFALMKYGPLSGLSHEQRLISAYYAGALVPQRGGAWPPVVCCTCGAEGHCPDECSAAVTGEGGGGPAGAWGGGA